MAHDSLGSETLAKIIDGSSIPSFVIDRQHKVIYWNTAMEALSGIKREKVIGTDEQWRAFYREKRPVMADLVLDGIIINKAKLEAHYIGRYKKSQLIDGAYEAEDFFQDMNKKGKWLHFTASPIRDDHGEITEVIETLEDITERKRAENALNESERSFRAIFEDARDAIWVHDLEGFVQTANKATADLTGYPLEELIKLNVKGFISEGSIKPVEEVGKRLLHDQYVEMPYEVSMVRKDGSEAICMVSTNLVIRDNELKGYQYIARDVTQDKRLQQKLRFYLQQITRAQEEERKRIARELHDDTAQLLGSLSRQLDNYLHEKRGLSRDTTIFLKDLRDKLNHGVQNVHFFIQDLLPPTLDTLGFVPAARSLINDLQKSDGINIDLKVIGTEKRYSPEVELLLFRIVQEGLNNIIRHAQASEAKVIIECNNGKVKVVISDNGRGFELSKIYDIPSRNKIGIIGMQERTQLLDGTLEVKSMPGKGTTLTLEVPV